MPGKLPPQRELLTSLVRALCNTSPHDDGGSDAPARLSERYSSSPVADIWDSPQRKKLILTLHVIFPGMLLPALDLVDRNLVRRLTLHTAPPSGPNAAASLSTSTSGNETGSTGRQAVYTVRSLASTLPRRGAAGGGGAPAATRTYLVHLDAWSCSCAGFAVDAYAGSGMNERADTAAGDDEDEVGATMVACKFGGRSVAGRDAQGAERSPCCKHLLACLLMDEWEELFATHVEERRCTKEELAGIVAGI